VDGAPGKNEGWRRASGPLGRARRRDPERSIANGIIGTSPTSLAIETGSKTFVVNEPNRAWSVGQRLRAVSDANVANWMEGLVTAYANDALVLDVDAVGGSGTKADWTINVAGKSGATDYNDLTNRPALREVLTANRVYYVRTDGSDTNDGLSNTAGGAFLTAQKALDTILGTLDLGGHDVTIQLAAGTYTSPLSFTSAQIGAGDITLSGDTTTPSNVWMHVAGVCATVDGAGCRLFVEGVKFTGAPSWFVVQNGGYLKTTGKNEFSDATGHGMQAMRGGIIDAVAPEILSGSTVGGHYNANINGVIYCQSATWTTSGTVSRGVFAWATNGGKIYAFANTLTGSVTGQRYVASLNGVVTSNGGGASYFPGSTAGSTGTGGQYA
jgi:hypothetical protein